MKLKSQKVTPLGARFERALLFATRKHAGQSRKGTAVPYVAHLLSVAGLVLEAGGDEDLAIAALLHDVVEDCGGAPMLKEIRRRFGKRVAHVVEGCTDTDLDPKPPWRERKEDYIAHLRTADADTRLVSGRRQTAQRPLYRRCLSRNWRSSLGAFSWQTRRHALVLQDLAGRIPAQEIKPPDPRTGTSRHRTGSRGDSGRVTAASPGAFRNVTSHKNAGKTARFSLIL